MYNNKIFDTKQGNHLERKNTYMLINDKELDKKSIEDKEQSCEG